MQETLELQKQRVEEIMAEIEELDKYRRVLNADLNDNKYNLYKRGIVRCRDCGKFINPKNVIYVEIINGGNNDD